jgi:phage protein D
VQHEDARPEPEPTAEKPIKVAAHTRAPRQAEPKAETAAATLPLSLVVAVPTDLMAGLTALIKSQTALIAKMTGVIEKIEALADAVNTTEPDSPQTSLPGLSG